MNCRQARSLFSARIDLELSREEAAEQDRHLTVCSDCRRAWNGFQTTVNLMHRLPVETPHPAFVGQVLDRVRAYEAQSAPTFLDPADRPWVEPHEPATSRWSRWRTKVEETFAWPRPIPVAFASALVLGVGIGFVASRPWSESGPSLAQSESTAPARTTGNETMASSYAPGYAGPFEDLVPHSSAKDASVGAIGQYQVLPPDPAFWSSQPGLQQQVRTGDERVRITF